MKLWNGKDLEGEWGITVKIDGVNATWDGKRFVSRANKPLYNINHLCDVLQPEKGETYEVFCGSFKKTISIVRSSKNSLEEVQGAEMFDLEPEIDPRLGLIKMTDPTATAINTVFKAVRDHGYEGLVLRGPNGERYKVKDKITLDLIVTGITEGKGRNAGRVGALVTSMGKVSGLSDHQRIEWWNDPNEIIGKMITAECMELTEANKMRHGRFVYVRYDKPMEEADG